MRRAGAILLIVGLLAAWQARAAVQVDAQKADDALRAFEADLESHDSATAVLQDWCDAHGHGEKIVARQVKGVDKPPTALAAPALRLEPGQKPRYRRVDLMCGDKVLSRADNWYLLSKLTPAMNEALDLTQTPFGVVVKPLRFTRRNLETAFLFQGGDPGAKTVTLPADVLQHSALLYTGEGEPFSFVVETYTDQVLSFTAADRP